MWKEAVMASFRILTTRACDWCGLEVWGKISVEYFLSVLSDAAGANCLCVGYRARVTQHHEYHVFITFSATCFGFLLAIQEV